MRHLFYRFLLKQSIYRFCDFVTTDNFKIFIELIHQQNK